MRKKDILEKVLLEHNDVFADVVNGTVFNGREVVKEDELVDTASVTHFKSDAGDTHEQIRDIAKFRKKNKVIFSFIGIEKRKNFIMKKGILKQMAGIENSAILLKADYQFKGAIN